MTSAGAHADGAGPRAGNGVGVIVWINGVSGVGKREVARELLRLFPDGTLGIAPTQQTCLGYVQAAVW